MITVAVADDQALLRRSLAVMLDAEPDIFVVGEAADGVEALEVLNLIGQGLNNAAIERELFIIVAWESGLVDYPLPRSARCTVEPRLDAQ